MVWICKGCTARYAVGAPRCPQCGGIDYVEEGAQDMPKITAHGGASVEAEETVVDTERGPELAPASEVGEQAEGGERPSDGNSSSASTKTQPSSGETSGSARPSTARAAANRSKK